ncbi:MAG: hypothetical protein O2931_04980 [Planctomycetota bacterium]|nr:hypothetical protein [Planctomycetota bacterium]
MTQHYTHRDLEAYLDEAVSTADMTAIEISLRHNESLRAALITILQRRDSGVHSLGEIWRRHQLSCPTREELGSYLLGVLDDDHFAFVQGHLEQYGCRICQANWEDLQRRQTDAAEAVTRRLKRFFETSAGYLSSTGANELPGAGRP